MLSITLKCSKALRSPRLFLSLIAAQTASVALAACAGGDSQTGESIGRRNGNSTSTHGTYIAQLTMSAASTSVPQISAHEVTASAPVRRFA
jgi:hypothetical protein